MTGRVFWLLFAVGVVAFACVLGLIHTGIEAAIRRHQQRTERQREFVQSRHCRVRTEEQEPTQ